jgi:DNA-binding response OmpR family regulator
MAKPFRFDELLARIRLRLRHRADAATDAEGQTVLEHGKVRLDLHRREATRDGVTVELSAREFALAEMFLRHPGQVLSREQLLSHVWGYEFDPGSNVVDVYVGYLRKKLGSDVIRTVRGIGYRLG